MLDLESILTVGLSKSQNQELNDWVGNSQARFDKLMSYFLHENMRLCQRASWVITKVCETRPHLIECWYPEIIATLAQPRHDAIIRNTVRAFQYVEQFPEAYEGQIFELSFEYLIDPKYPIAVKAFSMTVCRKIAVRYPDLISELVEAIEDVMEYGSKGVVARGRKELKLLNEVKAKS